MTFLELINDVLIRLREPQVASNNETAYSILIGRLVNDAKRQVEDTFGWNTLSQDFAISTVAAQFSYPLTGIGQKFTVRDALNTTSFVALTNLSFVEMNRYQKFGVPATSIPEYYAFYGTTGTDANVVLYPIPDGVYSMSFSLTVPQAALAADATSVLVPDYLVAQNAYARALVERGEDQGLASSEAYQLYRDMLSDAIALEGTRLPERQEFFSV
jgi:hypothetical protein